MPSRNAHVPVIANVWTVITDGAVASCRVENYTVYPLKMQATSTSIPPVGQSGAITLTAGETLVADLTLAQLFPGVGSGALFLWGFSPITMEVSVSHA